MQDQTIRMTMTSPINPNYLTIKKGTDTDLEVTLYPMDMNGQHGFVIQELKDTDDFHMIGAASYESKLELTEWPNIFSSQPIDTSIECFHYFFVDVEENVIENDKEAIKKMAMRYFGDDFNEFYVSENGYTTVRQNFLFCSENVEV